MSAIYLNHITLTTGHLVRSARPEAGDAAVSACAADLRRALAVSAPVPIDAPTPGCTLEAVAAGRALTATLSGPMRRPWVTLGVAPRATVAPKLWDTLTHALAPYHTTPRPAAPWAAAVLYLHDTPMWVADWERCLAWAWIEGSAT
jgi:hypothetical protein